MYIFNGKCICWYVILIFYDRIGFFLDCFGKVDGYYEFFSRFCDVYYKCKNGIVIVVKCLFLISFNKDIEMCIVGI